MISRILLPLGLALLVLASCTKDGGQEPSPGPAEQTTLSLVAEMPLEEEAGTRAAQTIDFELGSVSGQTIPRPKFTDGQKVPVHTILKSSTGEMDIKTVEWTYYADSKTLRLIHGDAGNSFTVANFNNDGGRVWYMAAMIGGELNGTRVEFNGVKVLTETSGQVGDAVGALHVPYYFPWTEVKIQTNREPGLGAGASYSYGLARPADTDPKKKFKPLGSLIGYQLGNAVAGSGARVVESFTVTSNAFADQGSFELDDTPSASTLPVWTPSQCSGAMTYTFAPTPPSLSPDVTPTKYYYAWVMPRPTPPVELRTRVTMRFTTSLSGTDFTKAYYTDYVPNATTGGLPKTGKVYSLKANAKENVIVPIQYLTEYNLAGGPGITIVPANVTPAPPGVQGVLRFNNRSVANPTTATNSIPHRNDQSGYYNPELLTAQNHLGRNPSLINIINLSAVDMDGTTRVLNTRYRVAELDDVWGLAPQASLRPNWISYAPYTEQMKVGEGTSAVLGNYTSRYAEHVTLSDPNDYAYVGVRFGRQEQCLDNIRTGHDNQNPSLARTYVGAPDDVMKCAYRFLRKGNATLWLNSFNNPTNALDTHYILEVVYLGNEAQATDVYALRDPAWWTAPGRVVFSRILPAAGHMQSVSAQLTARGGLAYLTSSTYHPGSIYYVWGAMFAANEIMSGLSAYVSAGGGQPLRLLYKSPVGQ